MTHEYMIGRKSEKETTEGEKMEVGDFLRERSVVLGVSLHPAWSKGIAQESSEIALVRDEETGLKLGVRKTSPLPKVLGKKRKVNGETLRSDRTRNCLLYTSDAADE